MLLEKIVFGNSIEHYIISLAIVFLFWGFGQIFSLVIVSFIKKLASKTQTMLDDILISVLERPTVFALFIAGFVTATNFLTFGTRGNEIVHRVTLILIVINVMWAVIRLLDALIEHYLKPLSSRTASQLDDHLIPFVKNFLKVIVIVIGLLFILRNMGYDITSLIAGLGIGGLAFALAAQPLLSNLFGGLAIITDKPFQMGDRIRVNQVYEGTVKEIGMRSTTIKTYNDTLIHIPNNLIATTAVENLSIGIGSNKSVRFTFNIGLEYGTSNEKIQETIDIIKNILDNNENVVHGSESGPYVAFTEFKDSSLNIAGGYTIVSPDVIGATRTKINLDIKDSLEKAGIQMAFPTQTIHFKRED